MEPEPEQELEPDFQTIKPFAIIVPSPANDLIRTESNIGGVVQADIHSSTGLLWRSWKPASAVEPIDVSALTSGIYFLSLISETGVTSTRFVVDH